LNHDLVNGRSRKVKIFSNRQSPVDLFARKNRLYPAFLYAQLLNLSIGKVQ
jgi:hypothetical protein